MKGSMVVSSYITLLSKFVTKRYPFQVTHFVTGRCNARCKHCFYWKNLNKSTNELTLDEISRISKSMPNFFSLMLTGGEPFLRDDLSAIARIYCGNNKIKNLGIPTNGLLTDNIYETAKSILDTCPGIFFTVAISLDGIGKDHDDMRGIPGIFEKVKQTYSRLSELKGQYRNFNVDFLMTVSKLNEGKLKDVYEYVKKNFNTEVTMIMLRGTPKNPDVKNGSLECYDRIRDLQKDKFQDVKSFNHPRLKLMVRERMHWLRHELIFRTAKEKRYFMPCYAGRLDAIIYEEGDVFPCEMLNMKMGNLREFNYDFRRLWNSREAGTIRKFIRESKCFCTHECAMRTNILFNPKVMLRGRL